MKKLLILVMVVLMAASAFAGCSAPAATTPPPTSEGDPVETEDLADPVPDVVAEPVTITVVTSYGGDDGNRDNYEAAIAGYEEATGNKVLDASATSNEEWKAKVMTDFETGTEPDVLFYFNNTDSNALVEADKVVSLEEIRAVYPDYAANMKDDLLVPSPLDGKVYSVPVNGYWESMFINKRVLEIGRASCRERV